MSAYWCYRSDESHDRFTILDFRISGRQRLSRMLFRVRRVSSWQNRVIKTEAELSTWRQYCCELLRRVRWREGLARAHLLMNSVPGTEPRGTCGAILATLSKIEGDATRRGISTRLKFEGMRMRTRATSPKRLHPTRSSGRDIRPEEGHAIGDREEGGRSVQREMKFAAGTPGCIRGC